MSNDFRGMTVFLAVLMVSLLPLNPSMAKPVFNEDAGNPILSFDRPAAEVETLQEPVSVQGAVDLMSNEGQAPALLAAPETALKPVAVDSGMATAVESSSAKMVAAGEVAVQSEEKANIPVTPPQALPVKTSRPSASRTEKPAVSTARAEQNPVSGAAVRIMGLNKLSTVGKRDSWLFLLDGKEFASLEEFKDFLSGLPAGTRIEWSPGAFRTGQEPLINSPEELDAFRAFCTAQRISFELK